MGQAVSGMTLMTAGKPMMMDIFSTAMPAVVTGTFATSYVASLSAASAVGRLGWSTFSDKIGRKNTYFLFGAGIPVAASIPYVTAAVSGADGSTAPLYMFYGGTLMMISFYGGLFSTLPAYIADVFGTKNMGAIHGQVLTAWSAAALIGPNTVAYFKKQSTMDAVTDLAGKVEPQAFQDKFGAPVDQLHELVETNTVSISRLMEIVPASTPDPTPLLYDSTMYGIAGMLSVAMLANAAIKPVDQKYHMNPELDEMYGARFFDRHLHTRVPLRFAPLLRLKRCHACDPWHSSQVDTASYRCHRKSCRNTEGSSSSPRPSNQ
jgi:hypothetical protein